MAVAQGVGDLVRHAAQQDGFLQAELLDRFAQLGGEGLRVGVALLRPPEVKLDAGLEFGRQLGQGGDGVVPAFPANERAHADELELGQRIGAWPSVRCERFLQKTIGAARENNAALERLDGEAVVRCHVGVEHHGGHPVAARRPAVKARAIGVAVVCEQYLPAEKKTGQQRDDQPAARVCVDDIERLLPEQFAKAEKRKCTGKKNGEVAR